MSTLPALDFILPGDPATLTGGYIYDRRIVEGLGTLGWQVTIHSLDGSFPTPTDAALDEARTLLARIPAGRVVLIDGLALAGMADFLAEHAHRLRLVALIHHPLACETGLDAEEQRALRAAEELALTSVEKTIVTSRWTAEHLTGYGVPTERIRVVEPGTEPAPLARGSEGPTLDLLCVATLTPRKGHALLVDALGRLRDRSWHLRCVGSLDRDEGTVSALRTQIAHLGLTDRISLLGEVDDDTLARCYDRADLFVLASHLEGYGMALAEALARGLPLISTSAGAIPETVPADAAILVPEGDSGALANALALVMGRPSVLRSLARGSRMARERLPTWEQTCARLAEELGTLR